MPKKIETIFKACMASKTYAGKGAKAKEKICRAVAVKKSGQTWVRHKKHSDAELMEEYEVEYDLNVTEIELSDTGIMRVHGIAVTDEFLPREDLEKYYKSKIGKKVLFDHFHPVKDEFKVDGKTRRFPVFGNIIKSELETLEDGSLGNRIAVDLYGFSPAHKHLQDMIVDAAKNGEDLGFSDHFFRYRDKDDKTLHVHFEETSITPHPVCEICKIDKIEKLSKGETMINDQVKATTTEKTTTEETTLSTTTEAGPIKNGETPEVEEKELSVDELKGTIETMNETILSQKAKIVELEGLITEKDTKFTTIEEELSKSKCMITFLTEKKPLLDELEEYLGGKYKSDPKLQEHYKAFTKEQLDFEVKRLKADQTQVKDVPIVTDPETPSEMSEDQKMTELTKETNEMFPEHVRLIKNAKENA